MDRRMYRRNMRGDFDRRDSSYRSNDSVCGDILGGVSPENTCDKDRYEGDFDRFPIGMCYVPWQRFKNLFENEFVALAKGTLFKDLDLDWYGKGGCR